MAAVHAYLHKLLYQYDCVVVPELGAFLTHYQPATFSEQTGIFLPPSKRIAFNEALRLDDGILANYIALHEPVTREGAQRMIARFVQSVKQTLEAQQRFELDGIGTFSRNIEGRLRFEPYLRHNFFGEAFGLSGITARLASQPVQANETPTTASVVSLPVPDTTLQTPTPARRISAAWRVAATLLLIGSLGAISFFTVMKPGDPLRSGIDPGSMFARTEQTATLPATAAATNPEPVAQHTAQTPTPQPQQAPVAANTSAVAAPSVAYTSPIATNTTDVVGAYRTGKFRLVAGSFSNRKNAQALRWKLRKAGFRQTYITRPRRRGQLYRVIVGTSTDLTQLESNVENVSLVSGEPAIIKPY